MFWNRKQAAPECDQRWVEAAYRGLMERAPDAEGRAHWLRFLAAGGKPQDLLHHFVHAEEFLAHANTRRELLPAQEVVRAAYHGLLERDPEKQGQEHWFNHLLAGGSLAEMLHQFTCSDEYLSKIAERTEQRYASIAGALAEPARRIAILSNCHGEIVGRCIQALTGKQPPEFRMLNVDFLRNEEESREAVKGLFAKNDVVLIQPQMAEVITRHHPKLAGKMLRWPSVFFGAFHPDQCYVRIERNEGEVKGPLGPYHSSIAFHAWRRGLKPAQALRLFRTEVFEELNFFNYWSNARSALLEEGERCDMDLSPLLEQWSMRGCFMHSVGHPKLHVLLDVARELLRRLEIPVLPVDPLEFVHDNLADQSIWPVYPEVGEQLGIPGAYVFKGNNPGVAGKSPVLLYGLEEFIERSYKTYEEYSAIEPIMCDRPFTERYERAFARQFPTGREAKKDGAPAGNPYAGLPEQSFWRKAVAGVSAAQLDPVGTAAFTLDRSARVATAGSCFAQHISRRLVRAGFNFLVAEPAPQGVPAGARNYGVYSARYGNLYTTRQLLQLFDRAYGSFTPAEQPWKRPDGRWADPFRPEIEPGGFASVAALEADRAAHLAATRGMFESLDVLVFTLGLTESWRSRVDGAVFPLAPGVAAGTLDATRHEFVNFSAAEVAADLRAFVERLAGVNPRARLILTVSPVPLAATYTPQHVLTATTYSKSALRVAAAELAASEPRCAYFPSYEIITGAYNRGSYYSPDQRNVNSAGVDHVMRLFLGHYAPTAAIAAPLDAELLAEAQRTIRIVCEEDLLDAPPA
jgi:hypothetical protein